MRHCRGAGGALGFQGNRPATPAGSPLANATAFAYARARRGNGCPAPMIDTTYPDALPAHSRLHWYIVERVLGQGGFGITYLARDTNLDQKVAVKEYLPIEVATRLPDAAIRSRTEDLRERYRWGLERFIQEARTLAQFDHPNIVRVHSVFEFNNTAYMVMRFEEGSNLATILNRRGTMPEEELLRILLPILDGLELIHKAGFIHRDIKPDNIYIRGDGTPVVLDFGSARQALGVAQTLTILVAPGYAPFEQYYSDSENQGPWTDIYGLGATCYRAIGGRAPIDAISRSKGILGSTQDVLVPASVIGAGRYSGRLLAAIDHALAFSEKDRPQTIAQWRSELVGDGIGSVAPKIAVPSPAAHGALADIPTVIRPATQEPRSAGSPAPLPTPSARQRWRGGAAFARPANLDRCGGKCGSRCCGGRRCGPIPLREAALNWRSPGTDRPRKRAKRIVGAERQAKRRRAESNGAHGARERIHRSGNPPNRGGAKTHRSRYCQRGPPRKSSPPRPQTGREGGTTDDARGTVASDTVPAVDGRQARRSGDIIASRYVNARCGCARISESRVLRRERQRNRSPRPIASCGPARYAEAHCHAAAACRSGQRPGADPPRRHLCGRARCRAKFRDGGRVAHESRAPG